MYGFVLGRAEREATTQKNNNGTQNQNTQNENNAKSANGNGGKPICGIVRTYPEAYANLFVGIVRTYSWACAAPNSWASWACAETYLS